MVRRFACIIFVGMMLVGVLGVSAESVKEEAALSEALKWLTAVDEGKYADSWNETAEYFKNAVKKA